MRIIPIPPNEASNGRPVIITYPTLELVLGNIDGHLLFMVITFRAEKQLFVTRPIAGTHEVR